MRPPNELVQPISPRRTTARERRQYEQSETKKHRHWDDRDTMRWLELILEDHPHGQVLLWLDQAPHHTSEEVEEWLAAHPRLTGIHFPAYTPEENPKEPTWKALKEEVSHHHWHETVADLSQAIDSYYQTVKTHTVNFLKNFGYGWQAGRLYALSS